LTLHQALAVARAQLADAGIAPAEASVDVQVYACEILGWDRARLLAELGAPAPAALEPCFSAWVARRAEREPTAYIVGRREFWGRDFAVSTAVLIPRPETELIVEAALALLPTGGAARVADLGTGSGCLAVSIAADAPAVHVVATDISAAALAVARTNAARLGVADRVSLIHTSYLDGVEGPFDMIISNPPYVRDADRPALSRQVAEYEPHVALFGGADGMRGVTAVLEAARVKLAPGGWLLFEFGLGQDDEVAALVATYAEFSLTRLLVDLQGIPRTAVVARPLDGARAGVEYRSGTSGL
jgi:release factor glutamine methyltransferase